MKIRKNKNFKKISGRIDNFNKKKSTNIGLLGLLKILDSPVIEVYDCIMLKYFYNPNSKINTYKNKKDFEYSNHLHMSDYCGRNQNNLYLLNAGIYVAKILSSKLMYAFPDYHFLISVSYDLINEEGLNDCVVQFIKIREGEDIEVYRDIDKFKMEAIITYEF